VTINQITATMTGWNGAPGYMSLYCQGTDTVAIQDFANAFRAWIDAIKGQFPTSVQFAWRSDYRQVNEITGDLVTIGALGVVPSVVNGAGTADFNAGAGASVNWLTADSAGSRLRTGRTYLVPLGGNAYESNGTLTPAGLVVLRAAAAAFVVTTGGTHVVWKRPVDGAGGAISEVIASRVNDIGALLKSRRD
jgi:hypothetical protein